MNAFHNLRFAEVIIVQLAKGICIHLATPSVLRSDSRCASFLNGRYLPSPLKEPPL
jgi:hypothetical protein